MREKRRGPDWVVVVGLGLITMVTYFGAATMIMFDQYLPAACFTAATLASLVTFIGYLIYTSDR